MPSKNPLGSFRRGTKVPGSRISGGGVWKPVVRGGRRYLKPVCPEGKYFDRKTGTCKHKTTTLKMKLKVAARKRRVKLRRGLTQRLLKRKRSLRRRAVWIRAKKR